MARHIKILYTIPNFDTAGSGKVVYDLVKGLDKKVFDPEICCFHNEGAYFKEVEKLGVKIHLFPFATAYRPFISFPFRVLKIYRFFKNNHFDVIHSWHWSSDVTEPLAAKFAKIPFVYTKKAMGWGNKSWIWRSQLSTKIITINEDMVKQFFNKLSHKVIPIPLGVDVDYFKPLKKTLIENNVFKLNKNDFVILSVANLVEVKGIEFLLDAVIQIKNENLKVFIVGDDANAYGKYLKAKYSFHENIVFFGKQVDVRPYLAVADVFVIPTKDEGRKEGLPIAPLEAMASARIVIGSKVSGIKDILKPFQNNLFEPNNVNDIKEKLEHIIALDNKEKYELETQMRTHVVANYNIGQFIANHELLYQNLKR